ncbi:MAG: hypothetical protein ACLR8P_21580 [Clostridium fessum]
MSCRTIRTVFDLIYVHSGTLYLEQDPFRVELNAGQFFIITPDTPHRGNRVCQEKTTTSWVHFYTNGNSAACPMNFTRTTQPRAPRRASPIRRRISFSPCRAPAPVPEGQPEKLGKYLQRMNLVSFSKYTQKKSFPSSVRTPFELQNDFIEFLQVLYAPYCYSSREKESSPGALRDSLDAHYTEEISSKRSGAPVFLQPVSDSLIRSFRRAYGAPARCGT